MHNMCVCFTFFYLFKCMGEFIVDLNIFYTSIFLCKVQNLNEHYFLHSAVTYYYDVVLYVLSLRAVRWSCHELPALYFDIAICHVTHFMGITKHILTLKKALSCIIYTCMAGLCFFIWINKIKTYSGYWRIFIFFDLRVIHYLLQEAFCFSVCSFFWRTAQA